MTRPSSCRHDVEWTTTGSRGYHFKTSSTASAGLVDAGSPMRSESACTGFIQTNASCCIATGRTSSVWATSCGDHPTLEIGGPIASTIGASRALLLRGIQTGGAPRARPARDVGHAPDRADLGRGDLLLMRRAAVLLDHAYDLGLRATRRPAAPARDLHQHDQKPRGWERSLPARRMLPWPSPKTWKSRPS